MPGFSKPSVGQSATALAQYLGMHSLGGKRYVASWSTPQIPSTQFNTFTGVAIGVPGVVQNFGASTDTPWAYFEFNPVAVAGTFDFGETHGFHIAISRFKAQFASVTDFFIPGRVVVFDPGSNVSYVYSAREVANASMVQSGGPTLTLLTGLFESENGDGVCNIKQGNSLQLWIEADTLCDGGAVRANEGMSVTTCINLFNFDRNFPQIQSTHERRSS